MSKRIIIVGSGVSAVALAGWYLVSSGNSSSDNPAQTPIYPTESIEEHDINETPQLNWTRQKDKAPAITATAPVSVKKRATKAPAKRFSVLSRPVKQRSPELADSRMKKPEAKKMQQSTRQKRHNTNTPWIKNLSGPHSRVALELKGKNQRSCAGSECEYLKDPNLNVAGVVLETERFGVKKQRLLKGQFTQGDGKKRPLVYFE